MKKNTVTEAIGGIEDRFIAEAMDYKCERRITMSKKKIAVIVAAAILLVALAIPTTATVGRYLNQLGYFGSLDDGTAVTADKESVKITAVPLGDDEFKFVVDADTSKAPFNEYSEIMITNYSLWNSDDPENEYPMLGSAAFGKDGSTEWFDGASNVTSGGEFGVGSETVLRITEKMIDKELHFKFEVYSAEEHHNYTLVVHAFTGRNADGELIEIQGEWTVKFAV